MTLKHL